MLTIIAITAALRFNDVKCNDLTISKSYGSTESTMCFQSKRQAVCELNANVQDKLNKIAKAGELPGCTVLSN